MKSKTMNLKSFSPIEKQILIKGVYTFGIIRNGQNFLTNVQVFENGLIDIWDLVDFDLLKEKIAKGWLIPSFPDGEDLSIHHLGTWKVTSAQWTYNKKTLYNYLVSIVKELNPKMRNLYDFHGSNTVKDGFVSVSKLDSKRAKPTIPHAEYKWQKVYGDDFYCFFKNGEKSYDLINVNIFPDGRILLSNMENPKFIDLEEFEKEAKLGNITTDIEANSTISILGLCVCTFKDGGSYIDIDDKTNEIKDTILELNGEATTIDICRKALQEYKANPTNKLKEKLKISYENVPTHLRIYLGNMDTRDIEYRMIIYGEDEIEGWSHYTVAKAAGDKLPSISIPKPLDDE